DELGRSIIRSKVQSPPVRASTLERPRLLGWLSSRASDRIRVIVADAGYGKTTLLADYARRSPQASLWYRLEGSDQDWVTFINYLIAAVREMKPDFAPSTASLLGQMAALNPSRDIVLGSFISELGSIGDAPVTLILDDFQAVDDSDDVQEMLERLFERAPANVTFVIASRREPALRLGRHAASGQLAFLSTDELRFSREETADLFAIAYEHPLDPDLLAEVDERTEGWGATLQLLHAS